VIGDLLRLRHVRFYQGAAVLAAALLLPSVALAEPPGVQSSDLQRRLQIVTQIQQLQGELRELRGALEQNSHDVEELKRRQREFYLDLDNRLINLESQPAATVSGAVQVPNQTATTATAAVAEDGLSPAELAASERDAYQQSFDLLKAAKYDQAITSFNKFLKSYPDGEYADNARYWVGEAYYVTRDFDQALVEFNELLKLHPDSSKRADTQLKVGYIYYEQKKWSESRQLLTTVATDPASGAAGRLAITRLDRMTQEGH